MGTDASGDVSSVLQVFRQVDTDKTGTLPRPLMQQLFQGLNASWSAADVDRLLRLGGHSEGEPQVDYEKLVTWMFSPAPGPAPGLDFLQHMTADASRVPFGLVVIGAGPAGLKAAIEAANVGVKVAIVDSTPLITGAPTGAGSKILREAALKGAKTWEQVTQLKDRALRLLHKTSARELRSFHVQVFHADAFFVSSSQIRLTPTDGSEAFVIDALNVLVASGSRANRFPPLNFAMPGVFDSDTINSLDRMPRSVVMQGGGPIGLEYALIFAKFGVKVVIVEMADKICQMMDVSVQDKFMEIMAAEGVEVLLKTKIVAVEEDADSSAECPKLMVQLEPERRLQCDVIISATGRHGCSDKIGLENVPGVQVGRGKFIQVDGDGHTGVAGVYAAGDVAGASFATCGQAQAVKAVRKMFGCASGAKHPVARKHKPFGVWTIPEIAWVGLTEQEAEAQGFNVSTGMGHYSKTVRGCTTNAKGFLKLVYERVTGKVLGVHILGEQSCELINYGAEVVNGEDTIFDILGFVFPAVTYHMLYHWAATEAKGKLMGAKCVGAQTVWRRVVGGLKQSLADAGGGRTLEDAALEVFKTFDVTNSGFVADWELKQAMGTLGFDLTDEEVAAMLLEATNCADERDLDYTHFANMIAAY